MGRMSLWQIMKYRSGWIDMNSPPKEPGAVDAFENMSDDDFFAILEEDMGEGCVIDENEAMAIAKRKGQ